MENKHILVVGATGETGKHLMQTLLNQGHSVTALVRNRQKLPDMPQTRGLLRVIEQDVTSLSKRDLVSLLSDVDGVGICLGYALSFKGVFKQPKLWLTKFVRQLSQAASEVPSPVKIVLMNTSGNIYTNHGDKVSLIGRIVLTALYYLLPPHKDNVEAAKALLNHSQDTYSNACVVRPGSLTDLPEVTQYNTRRINDRCPITGDGKVSRINVADFMAKLLCHNETWDLWENSHPLIYND